MSTIPSIATWGFLFLPPELRLKVYPNCTLLTLLHLSLTCHTLRGEINDTPEVQQLLQTLPGYDYDQFVYTYWRHVPPPRANHLYEWLTIRHITTVMDREESRVVTRVHFGDFLAVPTEQRKGTVLACCEQCRTVGVEVMFDGPWRWHNVEIVQPIRCLRCELVFYVPAAGEEEEKMRVCLLEMASYCPRGRREEEGVWHGELAGLIEESF
ncbi:hypothetical protein BJ508DRAFT_329290 [Ascobolus immersus RN42]|uniref:F-box domain-containing protein n=1 Tax=Ascobolus immersus RN42 TaxID=1160509 RepID=A0A3N4I2M1_ASCIM|nr:hypothetical protein BJ508DRAFT_329290 [Ascobolus immersus RN42]